MPRSLARLACSAALLAPLFAAVPALAADEFTPALQSYMTESVLTWASDPVLLAAVAAQNAVTGAYDQAQIDTLDKEWQSNVGNPDHALIAGVLNNAAAEMLRNRVADSGGTITEAFITDAKGLNVAASDATSDYWQGDEDKFSKVFVAADSFHISSVELDESTQIYQGQISVPLVDPASGALVGTLTVGVDAESLL